MKNLISKTTMWVAAGLLFAVVAKAENTVMRAEIPFKFVVGEKTLPSGNYLIRVDNESRRLELLGPGASIAVLPLSLSAIRSEGASRTGRLEFYTYGSVRVLRKVWGAGQWRGQFLPPSRLEKELARNELNPRPAAVYAVSR